MANVVDALVMTLGLDDREYVKGQKRADESLTKFKQKADAVGKDVALGGKKMAEGFSSVKNELLGLLALFGASVGIKDFIASNVKGQAELGRLSKNLNISARDLESWGLIAKEMGGQASDAFGALQSVAGGLAEASIRGHSAFTDMARANGVALTDAQGNLLSYEDTLVSISRRLHELPRQQALYLANQLGVGSMFSQLMLGPQELRKRLDAARRITGVTDESTAAAMRLQKQWADIQQRFKEASETAFASLSPVLERLAGRFVDWFDSVDWGKFASQIETLVGDVNEVVKEFGGWKTVAIALGGVLALKVLIPVLGLVGGLGRLIPLIASTTAGLWTLSAASAAVAGYGIGTLINKQIEGTKTGDAIGHGVALIRSYFGDEEAQKAILQNEYGFGGHVSSDRVKNLASLYRARKTIGSERIRNLDSLARVRANIPRGVRNNNPGNLNFAGQAGAHLEGGPNARFAAFDSLQEGIAALVRQLVLYASRGIDTITEIVNKYAPEADGNNVTAYIAALAKATGRGANESLDLANLDTIIPLVQAITRHEGNGILTADQVLGGIRLGAQQQAIRSGGMSLRPNTSETHIGKIEVHTAATDAKGIARDMRRELSNNALIAQADTGVQ